MAIAPIDVTALEVAHQIAQERTTTMRNMRTALESGDEANALRHARELCGLSSTAAKQNDYTLADPLASQKPHSKLV